MKTILMVSLFLLLGAASATSKSGDDAKHGHELIAKVAKDIAPKIQHVIINLGPSVRAYAQHMMPSAAQFASKLAAKLKVPPNIIFGIVGKLEPNQQKDEDLVLEHVAKVLEGAVK